MKKFLIANKRKFLKSAAVLLSITLFIFAYQGFTAWRAESKVIRACNLLFPIGNALRPDTPYGDFGTKISNQTLIQLENAAMLASAAAGDNSRYSFFRDEVELFGMNLYGSTSTQAETLHSPYSIYTYGIFPFCTNYMYLGENPSL